MISTSPWQQERHVMGMRKSPVEGSTIVMLKLDREFVPSDFVRPICLPSAGNALTDFSHCNTLGWARQSKYYSKENFTNNSTLCSKKKKS